MRSVCTCARVRARARARAYMHAACTHARASSQRTCESVSIFASLDVAVKIWPCGFFGARFPLSLEMRCFIFSVLPLRQASRQKCSVDWSLPALGTHTSSQGCQSIRPVHPRYLLSIHRRKGLPARDRAHPCPHADTDTADEHQRSRDLLETFQKV